MRTLVSGMLASLTVSWKDRRARQAEPRKRSRRYLGTDVMLLPFVVMLITVAVLASVARARAQVSTDERAMKHAVELTMLRVRAYAGSGKVGNLDGDVSTASFVQPAGLVWDERSRSLFVSDLAGQRIRRISAGHVTTLAGGGALGKSRISIAGGYVDGPAAIARFNEPLGMSLDGTGALLVADSRNNVIRRIAAGRVTTFAGRFGDTSGADGPRGVGSFMHPMALASASDGSLYIADDGVGLRKLSADGTITTVFKALDISGVSIAKSGMREMVWFSTFGGLHRLELATGHQDQWSKDDSDNSMHNRMGLPFQLDAVDADSVVFSDPESNTIRFFHVPDHFIDAIDRNDDSVSLTTGTIPNMSSVVGHTNAPIGVASLADDRIVFADSGAGRIEVISNFSTRTFRSASDDAVPTKRDPTVVRIAVVGDSYVQSNALWNDSVAGILQNGLNVTPPPAKKHGFIVDSYRIEGSSFESQADFASSYLAAYDCVILLLTDFSVGGYADKSKAEFSAPDYTKITQTLRATADTLHDDATSFTPVTVPLAFETAPWERATARLANGYFETHADDYDRLVVAARASRVPVIDVGSTLFGLETLPNRSALYPTFDTHLNRIGNIAAGESVLRAMLQSKPWLAH